MAPFNRLTRFNASGITAAPNQKAATMADETDDPDSAASRLEAALDRIARRAAAPPAAQHMDNALPAEPYIGELAGRLDSLIDRLRDALATK